MIADRTLAGPVETYHGVASVGQGRKVVAAAGTAEALASDTPCQKVDIQAELDNTDVICVGGSGVIAATATREGIALESKDVYSLEIDNLNKVYIDAEVNGEGVSFTYWN